MASELQTQAPKPNPLADDMSVYDIILRSDFQAHDFGGYPEHHDFVGAANDSYKFMDPNMSADMMKMAFHGPHYKMVNYNSNNNFYSKNYGSRHFGAYRAHSPRGYDSDDSITSHSSLGTPDNMQRGDSNEANAEFYARSTMYPPNLYQPNVNHAKNCNLQSQNWGYGNCRSKAGYKNSDILMRRAHGLMERFKTHGYKMKFNLNPPDLLNGGPWDELNTDIWQIFKSKIQKNSTYVAKLDLWKSIFLFIKKYLHNYGLFLVGSTMSGFALEGSDIDMCLLTKALTNEPRLDSLHHLNNLKHLLLRNGLASEAELIMAKVPILKFKNNETGFEIDLNCNNSVGIRNTHLLHCYAQIDWRVRPLVVIVKLWAQANRINDAKSMTISSYSWALMVIHYLQCGVSPTVLPCLHSIFPDKFNSHCESHNLDGQEEIDALKELDSENSSCLGDLLIGFFHYYSYFNYTQYAISVRRGARLPIDVCKYLKSPKNDPNQWKYLCIEEPFDFSNTARSVFDIEIFKHIREIIMASYKELARNKNLSYILPVHLNHQK